MQNMNPDSPVNPRIPAVQPDKADIEVRQYSTTEELLRRAGSLQDTNSKKYCASYSSTIQNIIYS